MEADINSIFQSNYHSLSPFVKMFWEEQKKGFQVNPSGRWYHPMIIRFALSIATKFRDAYDEIRNSGVLTLPSRRTLRDYRNFIWPEVGFNPAVVQDLIQTFSELSDVQRFVTLSLDDMKIQSDLVFQ